MNKLSDISIAILVIGLILLLIAAFIVLVGFQSTLEKRLVQCLYATLYIFVLVIMTVCLEENHWMGGEVHDVEARVWAGDTNDSKAMLDISLGLRGVNITVQSENAMFNEQFIWAWGTKKNMVDQTNEYEREFLAGFKGGKSLVVMQIAERFLTYGPLGSASPGLGVHDAGYYTSLILTIATGSWVLVGILPLLSLFASVYCGVVTCFCLALSALVYIVTIESYNVPDKAAVLFESDTADGDYVTLRLKYDWCFYLTVSMTFVTGALIYVLQKQAMQKQAKQFQKMQEEALQEKRKAKGRTGSRRQQFTAKRRLTAAFAVNRKSKPDECPENGVAIPLSKVIENSSIEEEPNGEIDGSAMKAEDVAECDINYIGPENTQVYGRTGVME